MMKLAYLRCFALIIVTTSIYNKNIICVNIQDSFLLKNDRLGFSAMSVKKRSGYLLICMTLLLAACGASDKKTATEESASNPSDTQTEDEGNEETTKTDVSNLLEWDRKSFDDSDHNNITISDAQYSDEHHFGIAYDGILLLAGDSMIDFFDYKNGNMYEKLEDETGPKSYMAHTSTFELFDDYFYSIQRNNEDGKEYITEVDLGNGNEKKIMLEEDSDTRMAKNDSMLFIENAGQLVAYDTDKEKVIWEVDPDITMTIYHIITTDKSIVLLSDEGLAVYSQADGEKLYESEGAYSQAVADGAYFYVLETTDEALMDDNQWNVVKFHEQENTNEVQFTTEPIDLTHQSEDIKIAVDEAMIYITVQYGLMAFDKEDGTEKWATAINGEFTSTSSDEPSYEVETEHHQGDVYIRTQMDQAGEDTETLLTILDGKTGEMKENYSFVDGDTFGPVDDGNNMVLMQSPNEGDPIIYIFN